MSHWLCFSNLLFLISLMRKIWGTWPSYALSNLVQSPQLLTQVSAGQSLPLPLSSLQQLSQSPLRSESWVPSFLHHMIEQACWWDHTAAPAPASYLTRFTMTMAIPTAAQRGQVTQPGNQNILKEWGKFWPISRK